MLKEMWISAAWVGVCTRPSVLAHKGGMLSSRLGQGAFGLVAFRCAAMSELALTPDLGNCFQPPRSSGAWLDGISQFGSHVFHMHEGEILLPAA